MHNHEIHKKSDEKAAKAPNEAWHKWGNNE